MGELFWSLTHRPYVTAFLLGFIALSWLEQGKLRTGIWLVTGYLVALVCEWASVHPGIRLPFGFYVYNEEALQNDLLVFGVPFFDSLSFAFLSYVSFSFAQFFMSPLWRRGFDVQRLTARPVRNGAGVLFLGAFLMTVIDIITDPVTHLGEHWFLGRIYHYPTPGYHFDVTLANYAGWFFVGWVIIFINQRIDAWLARRELLRDKPPQIPYVPAKGLGAPLFWAGIVLFMLGVNAYLGWFYDAASIAESEREAWFAEVRKMFLANCFVAAPVLVLAAIQPLKSNAAPRPEQIDAWLADYPNPKLKTLLKG